MEIYQPEGFWQLTNKINVGGTMVKLLAVFVYCYGVVYSATNSNGPPPTISTMGSK